MARVRLTRIMLVAAAIELVGFAANAAITSLTDDSENDLVRWSLPALVAVGVAMAQAGADAGRGREPPERAGRRGRGTSLAVAIVVVVLVVGAGGLAVAVGARYAAGWLTGNQDPVAERLAEPASGSTGPVTVEVVAVQDTRDFTVVTVESTNTGVETVELFLGSDCVLSVPGGSMLHADGLPFRSPPRLTVPGGATRQREQIVFVGHIGRGAETATLAFSRVWQLGPPLGTLTVDLSLEYQPVTTTAAGAIRQHDARAPDVRPPALAPDAAA